MRQYKRPYFQTKQYWGLVEILKNLEDHPITYPDLIEYFSYQLKCDNPKFKKELFLKALKMGDN